ncbi:MAG: YidC/Oxa1 family membrane protein insertase [Acidaminococcaceae bacterium]|nr:YidC/Oxa1 family membrane protein insertase [Acidaminococcaceae bacterium]
MIKIFDTLSVYVQKLLAFFYGLTGMVGIANYGLAIILMTIIVKLILWPLTQKQIQSMKDMIKIQPKMDEIRARYKDDKERMNLELANLYKTNKINPLSGCLPLLLQFPIMIGIFYGIRDFQYVGPANFLWMESISNPDPWYILPVLSALTTFITSKQTMPGQGEGKSPLNSKMMTYFMPVFIGYISITFPAGLVLYWVVMNLMQILQQTLMSKN